MISKAEVFVRFTFDGLYFVPKRFLMVFVAAAVFSIKFECPEMT